MSRLFDAGGKPMLVLSQIFDVLILSLIFLVFCVPVVTIGPALCALYHTSAKLISQRKGYLFRGFVHSFRINFKQAFPAWLILLAVMMLMGGNVYYALTAWKGIFQVIMIAVYLSVLIVAIMFTGFIFPTVATFECKFRQIFSNAMVMAVTHPLVAIGQFFLVSLFYLGVVYSFAAFPFLLFVLPVFFAWLQQKMLVKVFAEYMGED